jgi:hypothetical protein
MNRVSTPFDEYLVVHCRDVSHKSVRIERLKKLQADKKLPGLKEFAEFIGKKENQTSDLLLGRASFGEKVARSIEEKAKLPPGWLDGIAYWPFKDVDPDKYALLLPEQKGLIESAVAGMVDKYTVENAAKVKPSGESPGSSHEDQRENAA